MKYRPLPIFDASEFLDPRQPPSHLPHSSHEDYYHCVSFLKSYEHNEATFKTYRREVERFLQWSAFIRLSTVPTIKREDIEHYILFCTHPPIAWIGLKNVARFSEKEGLRLPNPEWTLFVVNVPKAARQHGVAASATQYHLSEKAIHEIFTILNCFYNFLIQENYVEGNPVAQIRQKSRFYRKKQVKAKIRRLSTMQWEFLIETAQQMAEAEPAKHERSLFIISSLYGMYLRISELAANERWTPKMGDFWQDSENNWWFTTVGKGNKERQIAVSDAMLNALKRWRKFLGHPQEFPLSTDRTPLIGTLDNQNLSITDTRHIRRIVQSCFNEAVARMRKEGFAEDAEKLSEATVHWLRHTGISDDVKVRPREHVRDDAGHSSSSITDKYIDVDLHERHASAKKKLLDPH
jgi:site-specific recombinase XerD